MYPIVLKKLVHPGMGIWHINKTILPTLFLYKIIVSSLRLFYDIVHRSSLLNTSYSRQLSADIEMKIKIKTSFVSPDGPKYQVNKTGINFMIMIFMSTKNSL